MSGSDIAGVLAYAAYLPHNRLSRSAIGEVLGAPSGRGTRTVASFDEDTTSMGVEAARRALRDQSVSAPASRSLDALFFATTSPAYMDKTNATAVHAALQLEGATMAMDVVGSVRNGTTALRTAAECSGRRLVVTSDVRFGRPGGTDERDGGDGAAAFVVGQGASDEVLGEFIGFGCATAEVLERWRLPQDPTSMLWEERFGEHAYSPLVVDAVSAAVKQADIAADSIDRWVVTGSHSRAVRQAAKAVSSMGGALVDTLTDVIGNTGAAHAGIVLASVLDVAEPGETIAVVTVADGVDVLLIRTTAALLEHRARQTSSVARQVDAGDPGLSYGTYLTWRGLLDREPPRRPDPKRPSPPPSLRNVGWKFGLVGSRCTACETRNLPAKRACVSCRAIDQMEPSPIADVSATVATFTIDRLTFSMSPPVVAAVLDFDGGGRLTCELTDVDPSEVKIGTRVEMTFRRLYTSDHVHDYFWKARPVGRTES